LTYLNNIFFAYFQIARLRQQHKSELQKLINEMSTNTTETRVTDLMKKLQVQESTIAHLKVQDFR